MIDADKEIVLALQRSQSRIRRSGGQRPKISRQIRSKRLTSNSENLLTHVLPLTSTSRLAHLCRVPTRGSIREQQPPSHVTLLEWQIVFRKGKAEINGQSMWQQNYEWRPDTQHRFDWSRRTKTSAYLCNDQGARARQYQRHLRLDNGIGRVGQRCESHYKKVSRNIQLLRLIRALWMVTLGRRPKPLSKPTNRIGASKRTESSVSRRGGLPRGDAGATLASLSGLTTV